MLRLKTSRKLFLSCFVASVSMITLKNVSFIYYYKSATHILNFRDRNVDFYSTDDITNSAKRETHILENVCKFPVLEPNDKTIERFIRRRVKIRCKRKAHLLTFQNGVLSIDRDQRQLMICRYRPIGGALYPNKTTWQPTGQWCNISVDGQRIGDDQFEVQCCDARRCDWSRLVYHNAYAQVGLRPNKSFVANDEANLSINIIALDSTAANSFRRHMPHTWNYLTETMGGLDLAGYHRVGDNSMPNLIPLLSGLRYGNLSESMISDFPSKPLLIEKDIPLIWNEFKSKGCVTMLNDDPMVPERGLFQYPNEEFLGMAVKPTEYYYRPWHVFHRIRHMRIRQKPRLCFENDVSHELHLKLIEQMSLMYKNTCYLSLNFFAEISHDDNSYLQLMDNSMSSLLTTLIDSNALNNTILILMGDHGQRVSDIRNTLVGKIEERMPLMIVRFPNWFRMKYPKLIGNFRLNKNRLTSHYDMYQVLKDIADGAFDARTYNVLARKKSKFPRKAKGLSLLQYVAPVNRSCSDANVPENHCTCMKTVRNSKILTKIWVKDLIFKYVITSVPKCSEFVKGIQILNVFELIANEMVQHGVRLMDNKTMQKMKFAHKNRPYRSLSVKFYEVEFLILPFNITALIRVQENTNTDFRFVVKVEPLLRDSKKKKHEKSLSSLCY